MVATTDGAAVAAAPECATVPMPGFGMDEDEVLVAHSFGGGGTSAGYGGGGGFGGLADDDEDEAVLGGLGEDFEALTPVGVDVQQSVALGLATAMPADEAEVDGGGAVCEECFMPSPEHVFNDKRQPQLAQHIARRLNQPWCLRRRPSKGRRRVTLTWR